MNSFEEILLLKGKRKEVLPSVANDFAF